MEGKPQILYVLISIQKSIIADYYREKLGYVDETKDYVFPNIKEIGNLILSILI